MNPTQIAAEALKQFENAVETDGPPLDSFERSQFLEAVKVAIEKARDFYKRRCDALQQSQSEMRDPERQMVCDILANGFRDKAIEASRAAHASEQGAWTTEPVRKSNGEIWEGLAYVNLPDGRGLGAMNAEQAKAVCREHNATLSQRPTPATARGSEQSIIALTVRKRLELLAKDAPDEWAGILMDEAKAIEQVIQQWPTPATVSEPQSCGDLARMEYAKAEAMSKPDSDSVDDFLLPCPFCGSDNVGVEPLVGGFVVDCKDCGGGCGTCHDEQAARDEWNKRKSLREILLERGIDSDKVSTATPSGDGEKWTVEYDSKNGWHWKLITGSASFWFDNETTAKDLASSHNATLQPRDCGEVKE